MRIYLWQLLRTFLKLQGVCFRDDTMTLQQYNIIISIMATIQEKLDETIKNQEAQKALFTEAFSEINAKLQEFVVKQGEYVEQIKALQAQIAAGTIGPEVLVTLGKLLHVIA